MNLPNWRTGALVLAVALAVAQTGAQTVVNIAFGGSAFSGQGAYSDPGHNTWNNVVVSSAGSLPLANASALFDSTGGAIGISIAANTTGGAQPGALYNGGWPGSSLGLFNNYIQDFDSTITLTLSGLQAGGTYTIYVYEDRNNVGLGGLNGAPESLSATIGGNTQTVTTNGQPVSSFILGVSYSVFPGVTANGSGQVAIVIPPGSPANFSFISGLQLVAIPEPSTYAVIASAFTLVSVFVWRRRRPIAGE